MKHATRSTKPTADKTPVEPKAHEDSPIVTASDAPSTPDIEGIIDARVALAVEAALAKHIKKAINVKEADVPNGLEDRIAMAVGKAMEQVIPATALALQAANASNSHASQLVIAKARLAKEDKCDVCGQSVSGCGGPWAKDDKGDYITDAEGRRATDPSLNHVKMCVFPKGEENAEWFTGVRINGKVYLSNGPGHLIWVPKKNDIAGILAEFERGERFARTPRKHVRQSGSISAGGGQSGFQPAVFTH